MAGIPGAAMFGRHDAVSLPRAITNDSEHEIQTYNNVTYSYINDEHLKQVTSGGNTYDLKYDALGRCVKRSLNGTTTYYIYDGEKPILEYGPNNVVANNVYGKGIDEILMRTDPSVNGGFPFYYGEDHEGSVTHLINRLGDVIERYKYDVFGAPTDIWDGNGNHLDYSSLNNRFLFTGREYAAVYQKTYVPAFNFYEYRARAYNPTLGRFMSEDPKGFDAGDYNLFRYCQNDPIDMTDPMGLAGDAGGAARTDTSSTERLWDLTKWFDRSNTVQGNFMGFAAMSGLSDRDAKGGLTMGNVEGRSSRGIGVEGPKVYISKAGNSGDRNSPDYYVDGPLYANGRPTKGVTRTSLTELKPHDDGSVTGVLSVNTQVLKIYKGTRVDELEQQHPQAWRDWHRSLSDKVFWKFKDTSFASPSQAGQAKANYIQNLYNEEFQRQRIWDRPGGPHDY